MLIYWGITPIKYNPVVIQIFRYLRLSIPEADLDMLDSSEARMTALKAHKQPHDRKDIINMLSDQTGKKYRVFQDFGPGDTIKTLAAGKNEYITNAIFSKK